MPDKKKKEICCFESWSDDEDKVVGCHFDTDKLCEYEGKKYCICHLPIEAGMSAEERHKELSKVIHNHIEESKNKDILDLTGTVFTEKDTSLIENILKENKITYFHNCYFDNVHFENLDFNNVVQFNESTFWGIKKNWLDAGTKFKNCKGGLIDFEGCVVCGNFHFTDNMFSLIFFNKTQMGLKDFNGLFSSVKFSLKFDEKQKGHNCNAVYFSEVKFYSDVEIDIPFSENLFGDFEKAEFYRSFKFKSIGHNTSFYLTTFNDRRTKPIDTQYRKLKNLSLQVGNNILAEKMEEYERESYKNITEYIAKSDTPEKMDAYQIKYRIYELEKEEYQKNPKEDVQYRLRRIYDEYPEVRKNARNPLKDKGFNAFVKNYMEYCSKVLDIDRSEEFEKIK